MQVYNSQASPVQRFCQAPVVSKMIFYPNIQKLNVTQVSLRSPWVVYSG